MTVREEIIQEALQWEGTFFQRGGLVRGIAGDCCAILWTMYERCIGIEPWTPYNKPPEPYELLFNGQWEWHSQEEWLLNALRFFMPALHEIQAIEAQPGDFVCTGRAGQPANHLAILLPNDLILHARIDGRLPMYGASLMRERRHIGFRKSERTAFSLE